MYVEVLRALCCYGNDVTIAGGVLRKKFRRGKPMFQEIEGGGGGGGIGWS